MKTETLNLDSKLFLRFLTALCEQGKRSTGMEIVFRNYTSPRAGPRRKKKRGKSKEPKLYDEDYPVQWGSQ